MLIINLSLLFVSVVKMFRYSRDFYPFYFLRELQSTTTSHLSLDILFSVVVNVVTWGLPSLSMLVTLS